MNLKALEVSEYDIAMWHTRSKKKNCWKEFDNPENQTDFELLKLKENKETPMDISNCKARRQPINQSS